VIGETAVIEDEVSILQNVTLGGTGEETGDRHPKIRHGVMIGAGAKILGNIESGAFSKVAAGSVVLKSVPTHCTTVAGTPATVQC
ncbi:serine O-acetyltransferase, partial [Rhizobium johnstonii]